MCLWSLVPAETERVPSLVLGLECCREPAPVNGDAAPGTGRVGGRGPGTLNQVVGGMDAKRSSRRLGGE